jgi:hypothetical protein
LDFEGHSQYKYDEFFLCHLLKPVEINLVCAVFMGSTNSLTLLNRRAGQGQAGFEGKPAVG